MAKTISSAKLETNVGTYKYTLKKICPMSYKLTVNEDGNIIETLDFKTRNKAMREFRNRVRSKMRSCNVTSFDLNGTMSL